MNGRFMAAVVGFMLMIGSSPLAVAGSACATGHARYDLMGAPGFTAGFVAQAPRRGWLTDAALFVHSAASGKTFWFLFDQGSARYVNLISTTDVTVPGWAPPSPDGGERPLRDMHYLAADSGLRFDAVPPRATAVAPTYILLPDLSETLWYGQKDGAKEAAPTAFFKLTACAP